MAVTFRYLLNGNTVTFTNQVDIDSMKGHESYVRVEETPPTEVKTPPVEKKTAKVKATAKAE